MNKKNLLELCLSPDLGGLELYMVRAAKALDDSLHVTSVINANGKLERYYKESSYAYEMIEKKSNIFMFFAAKKLAKIIDENHTDIVHLHWTKDIPIAVLAKKLSKSKPKIVQTRHMTMTRFKNDFYHRLLYKNIDLILPVTNQVKKQLEKFIPQDIRPKIEVLYMGSDSPNPLHVKDIEHIRHKYKMNGRFIVGLVGRINEAKGQYLLIEAIAKLKERDIHAYFVGHEMKKGYIDTLQILAKNLEVSERIHFLGFMDNPHEFFQICDTIILASKRETFGLVLIEAMQMQTAVIGSNSGGVVEIIDDKETGLLFEQGNSSALASAIKNIYNDRKFLEKIAHNGKQKAEKLFSNKRQFQTLQNILEKL